MRRRELGPMAILLAGSLLCAGCGGGGLKDATADPKSEPFVAKGKLRSEAEAKAALEKSGRTVPAR